MAYYLPTDWELKDFYRNNVDTLYRSCRFLTCAEADADEMAEAVLMKLLNKGMVFSSDKDGKAWMILAAYKLSKKPPRKKASDSGIQERSESEMALAEPEDAAPETKCDDSAETVDSHESDQEASCAATEENEPSAPAQIDALPSMQFPEELRKLSRRDRLIALMYYCEGFRKSEIARYLGCTSFMIGSRLRHIRKQILPEKEDA